MSVHREHGDKAPPTLFLSTALRFRRISRERPLRKRSAARWWIVLCSSGYTGTGYNVTCALSFAVVKERLTSSGESEPEEISPSCSWQDSGSFLCLSRKREKSDFLVFHLHAQRTGNRCLHMFGSSCRTLLGYAAFMFVSLSVCLCRSHISHTHRHM